MFLRTCIRCICNILLSAQTLCFPHRGEVTRTIKGIMERGIHGGWGEKASVGGWCSRSIQLKYVLFPLHSCMLIRLQPFLMIETKRSLLPYMPYAYVCWVVSSGGFLKNISKQTYTWQPGEKTQITAAAKDKAEETLEDQGCTVEVSDLYEVLCLFLYNYVHIFQFSDKLIITITLNVLDESRALAEVLFRL